MKRKIKICALAAALLIGLYAASSCAKTDEGAPQAPNAENQPSDGQNADRQPPGEEAETSQRQLNLGLYDYPDVNYNGHEFKVMIRGQEDEWDSKDILAEEDSGDIVESAVYRRNLEAEEKLNIKISPLWVKMGEQSNTLRKTVTAGDNAYDAVMMNLRDISNAAKQGYLTSLAGNPGIDLAKPWWDQSVMRETSVMNKIYFATGDISIADNEATWILMFNKNIAKELALPNIYDIVKKGEWTIDKFMELCKGVTLDLNGDGVIDHSDKVALTTTIDTVQGLFYSTGQRIVKKDADDIPYFALNSEPVLTNLEKIYEIFRGTENLTLIGGDYPNINPRTNEVAQLAFEENRALFYGECMQCVIRIRQMETEFGIIPLPKTNADQAQYSTYVHYWPSSMVAVPAGGADDDRTGAIIEALAYGGYKFITPAYYDVALKSKYARDDESSEMLDIIFEGRSADLGYVDDFGSLISGFQSLVMSRKNTFASTIEKAEDKVKKDIDKVIEKYAELP